MRSARRIVLLAAVAVLATACQPPGTDGIALVDVTESPTLVLQRYAGQQVDVELPHVPPIVLPDLSAVYSFDSLLSERLVALDLRPIDGVDVIEGSCPGGGAVYEGSESDDVFASAEVGFGESFNFEIDPEDGSSNYVRTKYSDRTRITRNADGSGQFVDETPTTKLSIEVATDGAGQYVLEETLRLTSVDVAADGSGVFVRESLDDLMTISLGADGSGQLYAESGMGPREEYELLTIDAKADGSGDLYWELEDRLITLRVRADRSWEYSDESFSESASLLVRPDGSGQYRQRGSASITIDFAPDGTNLGSESGPHIALPPFPAFVVAASFPPLGTLASLEPPCETTVLRFDSALLFEVNKAEVLPAAAGLLAEVAPALIEAGHSIEVNGHTDATGPEDYNQDLSERRAQAVADELAKLGVSVEMIVQGFGESQPVAENYLPDGSDDVAGQRQNRRVELVING